MSVDGYKLAIHDPQAQPIILQMTQRLVRHIWGSATPYRLGLLSRVMGLDNPYPSGSRGSDSFIEGREYKNRHNIQVML